MKRRSVVEPDVKRRSGDELDVKRQSVVELDAKRRSGVGLDVKRPSVVEVGHETSLAWT